MSPMETNGFCVLNVFAGKGKRDRAFARER